MSRLYLYLFVFLLPYVFVESSSRQKRCIVIQKQSGTHGDSTEGDDDRDIEPRKPEKRNGYDMRNVETLQPEFLRYKLGQTNKINDVLRFKSKLSSLIH